MGRIMAIDYGDVRIGIAMTDPMQIIAGSSQTLANTPDTFSEIVRMVKSESVEAIVFGMPYSEQATVGFAARKVVKFAAGLLETFSQNGINIPLYEQDEGYTTVNAYQAMSTMSIKKRKKKKQIVDQIAATKILQEFMDTKKKMIFDIEKYIKLINDTE